MPTDCKRIQKRTPATVSLQITSNPLHLPNIEELIEVGQIKVGVVPKLWCIAATADDEK